MVINKNHYTSTPELIKRMWGKVTLERSEIKRILDPEAGSGEILEFIRDKHQSRGYELFAIEIDENLKHILQGKRFRLIDSDFLNYSGNDKFDLIMMNPPFDAGDKHLMKAIDIMYSGEIVCQLNAETLRNPYTNVRKELAKRLEELNADIEYIQDAYLNADRKTSVEIALVHISIKRSYQDDFFRDCKDKVKPRTVDIEDRNELASSNKIEALAEEYEATINDGLGLIKTYYENQRTHEFLYLITGDDCRHVGENSNSEIYEKINHFLSRVRSHYWGKVLDLKDVRSRMTGKKKDEFNSLVNKQLDMEFTAYNVRAFIFMLIGSYEDIMTDAVADIFDKMTEKHHYCDETSKNTHYFNGWKTNKSFYCNKKVILPMGYDAFWETWGNGRWKVNYSIKDRLNDIDIVMNYFSGVDNYLSIVEAVEKSLADGISKNIESTFFKITAYKKNTIHLTFRDENIRRRFNVTACKHKKWLQEDYGKKNYSEMTPEEKSVVDDFEGRDSYRKNINQLGFVKKDLLQIA